MATTQPDVHVRIVSCGSCWTCEDRGARCDEALPACHECVSAGLRCKGYSAKIEWPQDLLFPSARKKRLPRRESLPSTIFSSLGLSTEENYLALHFIKNVAKIALAIDYDGNGYRKFAQMALHEPVILNAMLAVACSHISRWHGAEDIQSRTYFKKAISQLQQRFRVPGLIRTETTVVVMLMLISYEVFNGSNRWTHHYNAIAGWIRAYSAVVTLDPFLKTWITLIDTQSGLNRGVATIREVEDWSSSSDVWQQGKHVIDPLLGCSTKLPRLMFEAAQLYTATQGCASAPSSLTPEKLEERTCRLQSRIRDCEITFSATIPPLAVTCHQGGDTVTATEDFGEHELCRRAIATAEIFRHATHIYVYRINHAPSTPLSPEIQASIGSAFDLLPYVPDAIGPGANLGWALVVIGSEIDSEEEREYLRCRWQAMHVLGLLNTNMAGKLLEDVWLARDNARAFNWPYPRWQDIMRETCSDLILL